MRGPKAQALLVSWLIHAWGQRWSRERRMRTFLEGLYLPQESVRFTGLLREWTSLRLHSKPKPHIFFHNVECIQQMVAGLPSAFYCRSVIGCHLWDSSQRELWGIGDFSSAIHVPNESWLKQWRLFSESKGCLTL